MLSKSGCDSLVVGIDNVMGIILGFFFTGRAQSLSEFTSLGERPLQHFSLPVGVVQERAHFQVFHIIGAERVAMKNERRGTLEVDHSGVAKQLAANLICKHSTQSKVAITSDNKHLST